MVAEEAGAHEGSAEAAGAPTARAAAAAKMAMRGLRISSRTQVREETCASLRSTGMPVPLFDTSGPLAAVDSEIRAKVAAVLDKGVYILGDEVRGFEAELAAYTGVPHALGVANGTDAIVLALRALGIGPGDDVVVPSFTFYASAEAIALTGARPVFCDV